MRIVAIVCLILVSASLGACSKKNVRTSQAGTTGAASHGAPGSAQEFATTIGTLVHFTTDSTQLTAESQNTLKKQAAWLQRYSQYAATIEGHADERGTREYNLALGGRRAATVKNFLVRLGVSPARLKTITYGKERPVAVCNDISCWSKNRRAETRLSLRSGT